MTHEAEDELSKRYIPPHLYVTIYVEIPIGGGMRRDFEDMATPNTKGYPDSDVVPALRMVAYGCLPGTYNPADGDAMDAYILGAEGIEAGTTIVGKVLGIHLRNNGDHKLLVAQAEDVFSKILEDISQLPRFMLEDIARWHEAKTRSGEYWASREVAISWIQKFKI